MKASPRIAHIGVAAAIFVFILSVSLVYFA
jgi:hypothetical protein